MFRSAVALLAGAVLFSLAPAARAGDGCTIVGTIAVEAVKARATQVCVVSGHPVACAIAAALNTAAGDGLAKMGTTASCEWVVKKVGPLLEVTIKTKDKAGTDAARAAETELKKAKEYKAK